MQCPVGGEPSSSSSSSSSSGSGSVPWKYTDTEGFNDAGHLLAYSVEELLPPSATRRDSVMEQHLTIVDIHRAMRENYKQMIHRVGRNIYPLIVARDNEPDTDKADIGRQGLGGTYTLYLENGDTYSVRPAPREYEMFKALSHMPLGLYTIVSPFFQNPYGEGWKGALATYQTLVRRAQRAYEVQSDHLSRRHREIVVNMLGITGAYVDSVIDKGEIHYSEYMKYTARLKPWIVLAMDQAATCQMRAVLEAMTKWKVMLGPLWRDVFVCVPTVWPVTERSPRWQVFKSLMDPDRVPTHLITMEGVGDVEAVRDTLGRIVGDRGVARMVFHPDQPDRGSRLFKCLSSRTDLVSDSAYTGVTQFFEFDCLTPEERRTMEDAFEQQVLQAATENATAGGRPSACLITEAGRPIALGKDAVLQRSDPTATAVVQALQVAPTQDLSQCEVYVTGPLCALSSAALKASTPKKVVVAGAAPPPPTSATPVVEVVISPELDATATRLQDQWVKYNPTPSARIHKIGLGVVTPPSLSPPPTTIVGGAIAGLSGVLRLAAENVEQGGDPVACVIARGGDVLGVETDRVAQDVDQMGLAELRAAASACRTTGGEQLTQSVAYVNRVPGPVALAALGACGVQKVYAHELNAGKL